ncbi:hypothetical protein [Paracidovorax oryzae]|uniref:hypothetical protein n=1 Tax=Paracidovorax oryzae TaxID=862720 RepID=UPI000A5432BB|nr:hypothetical protein [Paracidovorax oryzae]
MFAGGGNAGLSDLRPGLADPVSAVQCRALGPVNTMEGAAITAVLFTVQDGYQENIH